MAGVGLGQLQDSARIEARGPAHQDAVGTAGGEGLNLIGRCGRLRIIADDVQRSDRQTRRRTGRHGRSRQGRDTADDAGPAQNRAIAHRDNGVSEPAVHLQLASVDRRRAAEVAGPGEFQRPGAALVERAHAIDLIGEGRVGRLVDNQRRVVQDGPRAEAGRRSDQRPAADGRSAAVVVDPVEDQRAQVGLHQLAGPGERRIDGCRIARSRRGTVADLDGRRPAAQGNRVALDHIAVDGELHAAHGDRAGGLVDRHRPRRAGEDDRARLGRIGAVGRAVGPGPVRLDGVPHAVTAVDDIVVRIARGVAVPIEGGPTAGAAAAGLRAEAVEIGVARVTAIGTVVRQQREDEVVAAQGGDVDRLGHPVGVVPVLAGLREAARRGRRVEVEREQRRVGGGVRQGDDEGVGIGRAVRGLQHRGIGKGDLRVGVVVHPLTDHRDAIVVERIVHLNRVIALVDGIDVIVGVGVEARIGDGDRLTARVIVGAARQIVVRRRIGAAVPIAAAGGPAGQVAGLETAVDEGPGVRGACERNRASRSHQQGESAHRRMGNAPTDGARHRRIRWA